MTLDLDRQDLICLIKGTGGPKSYTHPFSMLGEITGFPNEKWYWNDTVLNNLPEWKLIELYKELKEFNSK
jgi:hypothetical protein